MANYGELTPVNIITGFLGSGKTTLLQRLLRSPELSDVAVLVNEFGEVGLDHHLLQGVAESTLLLENGCVCCAVRGDLQKALRDLLSRRTRGELPHFRRVVIETSGLGRSGADRLHAAVGAGASPSFPPVRDRHHGRRGQRRGAARRASPRRSNRCRWPTGWSSPRPTLSDAPSLAALRARLRALNRLGADLGSRPTSAAISIRLLTDDIYDAAGKFREASHWTAEEVDAQPRTSTPRAFNPLPRSSTGRWIGPRSASGPACCCIATAPTCCG